MSSQWDALVAARASGRAGAPTKVMPNGALWSGDVVRQWKDVRMAKDGTTPGVKKGARHHRESMICAGRALHWIQTRAALPIPEARVEDPMRAALRKDFGRPVALPSRNGRRGRGLTEIFRPEL